MYLTYICYIINKSIGINKMMWFIDGDNICSGFCEFPGIGGFENLGKEVKAFAFAFFLLLLSCALSFV